MQVKQLMKITMREEDSTSNQMMHRLSSDSLEFSYQHIVDFLTAELIDQLVVIDSVVCGTLNFLKDERGAN